MIGFLFADLYFVTRIVIPVIGHCVISTSMKLLLILEFLIANVKKKKKKKCFYKRFLNVGNEKTVLETERGEREREGGRDRQTETERHTHRRMWKQNKKNALYQIDTDVKSFFWKFLCKKYKEKKKRKKVPVH